MSCSFQFGQLVTLLSLGEVKGDDVRWILGDFGNIAHLLCLYLCNFGRFRAVKVEETAKKFNGNLKFKNHMSKILLHFEKYFTF